MVTSAVTVRVRGLKEVNRYLAKLPSKTKKEGNRLTKRVARFIMRSAKQRVPKDTKALMSSIEVHPSRNGYTVSAGRGLTRGYAAPQEFGFAGHFIHKDMIQTGSRLRRKRKNFFYVSKPRNASGYFMGPAYRAALNRLTNIELKRTANNLVK